MYIATCSALEYIMIMMLSAHALQYIKFYSKIAVLRELENLGGQILYLRDNLLHARFDILRVGGKMRILVGNFTP